VEPACAACDHALRTHAHACKHATTQLRVNPALALACTPGCIDASTRGCVPLLVHASCVRADACKHMRMRATVQVHACTPLSCMHVMYTCTPAQLHACMLCARSCMQAHADACHCAGACVHTRSAACMRAIPTPARAMPAKAGACSRLLCFRDILGTVLPTWVFLSLRYQSSRKDSWSPTQQIRIPTHYPMLRAHHTQKIVKMCTRACYEPAHALPSNSGTQQEHEPFTGAAI